MNRKKEGAGWILLILPEYFTYFLCLYSVHETASFSHGANWSPVNNVVSSSVAPLPQPPEGFGRNGRATHGQRDQLNDSGMGRVGQVGTETSWSPQSTQSTTSVHSSYLCSTAGQCRQACAHEIDTSPDLLSARTRGPLFFCSEPPRGDTKRPGAPTCATPKDTAQARRH